MRRLDPHEANDDDSRVTQTLIGSKTGTPMVSTHPEVLYKRIVLPGKSYWTGGRKIVSPGIAGTLHVPLWLVIERTRKPTTHCGGEVES